MINMCKEQNMTIYPGSHEDWEQSAGDSERHYCDGCGKPIPFDCEHYDGESDKTFCKHCFELFLADKEAEENE